MDSALIDGLPLGRAPVDDIDGCPMGWDPLDGVPVDDIDGVAIDDIDGMPCESSTSLSNLSPLFHVSIVGYLPCGCISNPVAQFAL